MTKNSNVQEFPTEITETKFNEILANNEKIIVDVYTDWCTPCKNFAPIFGELSEDYQDIKFISINSDATIWINEKYNIDSIPRFLFFNKEKLVYEHKGASSKENFEFQIKYRLLDQTILNDMKEGISEADFGQLIESHPMIIILAYEPNNEECEFFKPSIVSLMEEFKEIYFLLVNAEKSDKIKSLMNIDENKQHGHLYPYLLLYKDGVLKSSEHIHYPDLLWVMILEDLLEESPIKRYNNISEDIFNEIVGKNPIGLFFIYKENSPANNIMKSFLFNISNKFKDIHLGSIDFNKNKWIADKYGIKDESYSKFGESGKKLPYFLYFKNGSLVHESGPIEMDSFFMLIQEKLLD